MIREAEISAANFKKLVREKQENLVRIEGPTKQSLFSIYHLLMNQRSFTYTVVQAVLYYLKCLQCCRSQSLRQTYRNDLKLNKGIRLMSNDLDIVNMIKRIKDVGMLIKVNLSRNERILLNH